MVTALIGLSMIAAAQGGAPRFLKDDAIDPGKLLPEPAGENCPETKSELDWMVRLQETRTHQEIARAGTQAEAGAINFQDVFGPWFNEEDLPQTMTLLRKVNREGKYCCDQAKQHFSRRRPRFVDARIKPIFGEHAESCYPSGHAVQATVIALVLAEMAPEYKPALMERSREIGWNRVIAGLHYPSDCVAGRGLGQAVAQALLADPAFKTELAKVKPEFDRVKREHFQPVRGGCR
jgi:acid phosphatase (class A)